MDSEDINIREEAVCRFFFAEIHKIRIHTGKGTSKLPVRLKSLLCLSSCSRLLHNEFFLRLVLVDEIPGIFMVQYFLLLVGADMGINLSGGDGAVSEDMLYIADVHVLFQ